MSFFWEGTMDTNKHERNTRRSNKRSQVSTTNPKKKSCVWIEGISPHGIRWEGKTWGDPFQGGYDDNEKRREDKEERRRVIPPKAKKGRITIVCDHKREERDKRKMGWR